MKKISKIIRFNRPNESGFTFVELLVIIGITATIAGIVLVNFQNLRAQQEMMSTGFDFVSKIREVQNFILSGKIQPGKTQAADSYQIVFTAPSQSYRIDQVIRTSPTTTTTSTLETVSLNPKIQLSGMLIGATAVSSANVRIESPYGKVLVNGSSNQILRLNLTHMVVASRTKSIYIDGISGRISQ